MLNFHVRSYAAVSRPDYVMKVDYTKTGEQVVSFPVCDNRKIVESNGTVDMWSLSSLLRSGVDPKFNIHTSGVSPLDGYKEFSESSSDVLDAVHQMNSDSSNDDSNNVE